MPLFKPDYYVKSFRHVDINRLKRQGIKLLLCDIDNTLVAFDDPDSNKAVHAFVDLVHSQGIDVALMSNNVSKRTNHFGKDLGVDKIYSFSLKPLPFTFQKAMKDYNVTAKETAILGDQLFTDILGGKAAGVYTILTAPIAERERLDTWLMRFLERLVYQNYEKRKIMKRGDFDE